MAMHSLQLQKNLEPTKTWQRPLAVKSSSVAAAAETFYIDLPKDHFIHKIIIHIDEHTAKTFGAGTLADDILDIKLVGNGNKYLKDMIGTMCKTVMQVNKEKPATGVYVIYFSDPKIKEAKPLPAWVFTSLQLILTDNAPAASNYHNILVTIVESAYQNEDLTNWKVLIEKYVKWAHYGTNTLWQEYMHERAYLVYGYIYAMDDDSTLSATIFDRIKIVGRKPTGEVISIDDVRISVLVAENNGEIGIDTLVDGYCFLEWAKGYPTKDFSSLISKLNIPTAGTNAGLRVLERYVL